MKIEYLEELIDESNKLMIFTMSMQIATRYTSDKKFDSANFSRILQEARKELEGIK